MGRIIRVSVVVIAAMAGTAGRLWAASGDGLEGSNWKMRQRDWKSALMFWKYDHLTFKDGQFMSVDCKQYGFSPASYAATKTGESMEWTATLKSEKDGQVVWEGKRTGNKMSGSYTWIKPTGEKKVVPWGAKQVMHEHPEHPAGPAQTKEHPREHPAGMEHPGASGGQAPAAQPQGAASGGQSSGGAAQTGPSSAMPPTPPKPAEPPKTMEHPGGMEHPHEHPR